MTDSEAPVERAQSKFTRAVVACVAQIPAGYALAYSDVVGTAE
jgi:alkylated DNA nucleotide flippase Atl1